jgi:hypothetical protein
MAEIRLARAEEAETIQALVRAAYALRKDLSGVESAVGGEQ